MEIQTHTIGERTDKLCATCKEERGHIVASLNKRGQISRVSCTKCGTLSTFKLSSRTTARIQGRAPSPYDRTRIYHAGQTMTHAMFGDGEVTAVIEPQKIDVLFPDRVRRLVHSQS